MFYGSFRRHHPGSRIRKVDEEKKKALVHYHGWGANFDKWVDFSDLAPEQVIEV